MTLQTTCHKGFREPPSPTAVAQKVGQMKLRRLWLALLRWGTRTDDVEGWRSSLLGHGMGSFR